MSRVFKIAPGKYDIPKVGKVDANLEVTDEKAFSIYKLPRRVFPWIELGPEAENFLKKQKLSAADVASLVQNARTTEEVMLLAKLSDTKKVQRITETKLQALEYDQNQK